MSDIALLLGPDGSSADLSIVNGDIATDAGLQTAIVMSLLTDRLADPDDVIPDGSQNRRGWWADIYLPPLPDGTPDLWGSKLWLRRRCTATQANALLIQDDVRQALAWMIADGAAAAIDVGAVWISATGLAVTTTLSRNTVNGTIKTSFGMIWDRMLGTIVPQQGFFVT